MTWGIVAVAHGFQGEGPCRLHLHQRDGLCQEQREAKGLGKEGALSGTPGSGQLLCIPQTVFSCHVTLKTLSLNSVSVAKKIYQRFDDLSKIIFSQKISAFHPSSKNFIVLY